MPATALRGGARRRSTPRRARTAMRGWQPRSRPGSARSRRGTHHVHCAIDVVMPGTPPCPTCYKSRSPSLAEMLHTGFATSHYYTLTRPGRCYALL